MLYNKNNKRAVETFLVTTGDQALYNTAGAGNHINNTSTGGVRLANGQLGFFASTDFGTVKMNIATDATPVVAEAPVFYIAQGTADSANPAAAVLNTPYPLWVRPFERSGDIAPRGLEAVKQAYVAPSNAIYLVGHNGTTATPIVPLDNAEYSLTIAYKGRIIDAHFHNYGTTSYIPSFTTPNYTDLGTVSPADHLIQNLVWNINRNSIILTQRTNEGNEPVVAMAIDLAGTVGTAVASLTAGTFLPLINTPAGFRGLTLTAENVANLQSALPAGSSIVTVDLTTAGTAAAADAFAVMALDRRLAYYDKIDLVKIDIVVTNRLGFADNVAFVKRTFANEGQGVGRSLNLEYRRTHHQRKYNLNHEEDPVIEFPSPVNVNEKYVVYRVRHENARENDTFHTSVSPELLTILVPSTSTTTITQLDAALNSWLGSAGTALVTI